MATAIIDEARVRVLNERSEPGEGYVLYWMQQSQRAEHNPALEYAVRRANDRGRALLVVFGLMDGYPEANVRHYRFMLEGLQETQAALARRGIPLSVRHGSPDDVALDAARHACLVVVDRGYTRHQKAWRQHLAEDAGRPVHQVEGDVVVPVETASDKAEYAARTLRPKLKKHLDRFLVDLRTTPLEQRDLSLAGDGLDLSDLDAALDALDLDRSVPPVSHLFRGGTRAARRHLKTLLEDGMAHYDATRNRPETSNVSHLSKYLHFGQISPVYVALQVQQSSAGAQADRDSFLEELIVRRELTHNFVHYTRDYDQFVCLPGWARQTLEAHADDDREYIYTERELEAAATHDPYWNAAMREMKYTGYMHNYMRMYWGKKILEWTNTPGHAYRVALKLNNKYFLDGRDPNSFANVGWLFGLHDRPWQERPIYGKVRYLSAGGLKRKADPDAYVEKVKRLVEAAQQAGVRFEGG